MFGSLIAGAFVREKVAALTDTQATPEDFALLSGWLDAGTVRPVIDRVYPLESTADAMRKVEGGRLRGRLWWRSRRTKSIDFLSSSPLVNKTRQKIKDHIITRICLHIGGYADAGELLHGDGV